MLKWTPLFDALIRIYRFFFLFFSIWFKGKKEKPQVRDAFGEEVLLDIKLLDMNSKIYNWDAASDCDVEWTEYWIWIATFFLGVFLPLHSTSEFCKWIFLRTWLKNIHYFRPELRNNFIQTRREILDKLKCSITCMMN